MKNRLYNLLKLALVAILALTVGSCQKPYEMDLPLAVSRAQFTVKQNAGQVFFIVYSQEDWTADFETPVEWARLSRTSGGNCTQVNISYDENLDLSRGVNIVVRSGNLTRNVYLSQKPGTTGEVAYNLDLQSVSLLKEAFSVKINASTNVPAANIAIAKGEVNYVSAGDEWISDIVISEDKVSFEVAENNTGAVRQAIVSITFPVAEWDSPITAMVAVTQSATPASFGQVPTTVVADPNGINPISIELQPSFTPSLYGFGVDYSLSYTDGQVVDWLRNPTIDAKSFKFTAEPKPNPYPARTAVVTFRLLSASGAELSTSTVTITQDKSDMGTTEGGNDNGEEPKDPEEDF